MHLCRFWRLSAALAAAFLLLGHGAWAQAITQSGPILNGGGHVPMYLPGGFTSGLASVMDSGPASGGANGYGLSELLLQQRTTGTGPDGTNLCDWSTYATNSAGANYLCLSANALGGGLIDFNSPAGAGLNIKINGKVYSLPSIFTNSSVPPGFVNVQGSPYFACTEGTGGYGSSPINPAGTCDATAAINAALASGQNVYFPPGWYHVTNQLTCNGYGQQLVGAGRLQSVIDVGSDMNMGVAGVVNLGGAATQVSGGCEWRDLGIQFYQNVADTTRSQLIQYPPAITSAASRLLIDNIRISRGWTCLKLNGNYTVTMVGDVELGCFSQGLYMDGQLDYSFIHSIEIWPFGSGDIAVGGSLVNIWNDTTTQGAYIGRSDGLEINNLSTFSASVYVANDELTSTGIDIGVLHMDAYSTLTHTSGALRIGVFGGADDGAATAIPTIVENVGSGVLGQMTIGTIQYETSNSNGCAVTVHGGKLIISGGYWFNNVDESNFCEDTLSAPSYLELTGLFISPPTNGVSLVDPLIKQTAGALVANNLVFNVAASGATGTMISIASDNGQNHIANNNYGGWGSPVSLGFLPLASGGLGIAGYYDLGALSFPLTATPAFSTAGDFAPTSVTCTGCQFSLNGDYATFDLNLSWTNNAYSTAGGTFEITSNLPRSISPTGVGSPFPLSTLTGMSLGSSPQQFPLGANLNGASTFSFQLASTGTTGSLANPTNFPAGRGYQVVVDGRYPIRPN